MKSAIASVDFRADFAYDQENRKSNPYDLSNMNDTFAQSLKGQLLIAMPELMDPNFYQTVTCLSEHTKEGAVGIVINRTHAAITTGMIFKELGIECIEPYGEFPVYIGGPVHINEVFILHSAPSQWEGSLVINESLALSNSLDILEAIAKGQGPESFLIALGCAGWGPGQLEYELSQNAWLTAPYQPQVIFETPLERRWEAALRNIGVDPELLSGSAGHA